MTRLLTRSATTLTADPRRVLARLFVPGHELLADSTSRASGVLARILALPEDVVASTVDAVRLHYSDRHRDLPAVLADHFTQMAHRVPDAGALSEARRSLVGAVFTSEFAIEGAALFNPSAVASPDQSGLDDGQLRFVLSLRAVGEGHISSVEFRTGVVGPGPQLRIDAAGRHVEVGRVLSPSYDRELFAAKLAEEGSDGESASYLVSRLPARFGEAELEHALGDQYLTQHAAGHTNELARRIAHCTYEVDFAAETTLDQRVLWPHSPSESRGIEDARFTRFVEEDGEVDYRATYTAFDGDHIAPQLIETTDFRRFRMSQLAGPAAKDKGMALFPRRVGGQYLALTRSDRETSGIATSIDGRVWSEPVSLHVPSQCWELVQSGNCGSPIETRAGWIVLTHGVGPMREYTIGALLLDLDDPCTVIGALDEPLVRPDPDERDGYVPNVVYSCGSLRHGDLLLLPYGASDASVRFAFVDLPLLLDRLTSGDPPATRRENRSA